MKQIEITRLLKNGITITNDKFLTIREAVNILPFVAKSYRAYTTFRKLFDFPSDQEIIKTIQINNDNYLFLTNANEVYLNDTLLLDSVYDIEKFNEYFVILTNDNKLHVSKDLVSFTEVDLPDGANPNKLVAGNYRLIVINTITGLVWFSGFQDPHNFVENTPDETLNAFYHEFKEPIIDIFPLFNELIIITKGNVYRKRGDYPYEIVSLLKTEEPIQHAFKLNNQVYLFYDNTFATLQQTAKYGDYENVNYIDQSINGYKTFISEGVEYVSKFHRGFLINSRLYYDEPTKTFWLFAVGNHLHGDVWQLDDGIYQYTPLPPYDKKLQATIKTNKLYFNRSIIRRIIFNLKGYDAEINIVFAERYVIPLNFKIIDDVVGYDFDIVGYDDDPLSTTNGQTVDKFVRLFSNKDFSIYIDIKGALQMEYLTLFVEGV